MILVCLHPHYSSFFSSTCKASTSLLSSEPSHVCRCCSFIQILGKLVSCITDATLSCKGILQHGFVFSLVLMLLLSTSGFAFVYFEDERDAEDAIRGLDNVPFGHDKRRLSVEWAKGERGRHRDGRAANQRPTKTLFVINFDPVRTRVDDIERHFEPYGKVLNVRIRRNFAFVQFETQEDATKALDCTHMSKVLDRVVSVEYSLRDDDERGGMDDRYERRGGSPRRRSPSPGYRRTRPSPDYGRRDRSPVYDRYNGPAYDRPRTPDCGRYRSRSPVRRSRT